MASLMTGNAHTMTIPQLNNVINKLKGKLKDKEIGENETLRSKVENLIYDYTKAKNKILRYYEKTKSRNPALVVGKKNTLTIVQILKNQGKFDKAAKLSTKEQKWSYNAIDFLRDANVKGIVIGIGTTSAVLGVANIISMNVAQKGIFDLIGQAIGMAFKTAPVSSALITAGIGIAALAIIIPKIARLIHKIKMNKASARELNNEILEETSENDLDLATMDKAQMIAALKDNPDLLEQIQNGTYDFSLYTPDQVAKMKNAAAQIELERMNETRQNYAETGQAAKVMKERDPALKAFEEADKKPRDVERTAKEVEYYKGHIKNVIKLRTDIKDLDKAIAEAEAELAALKGGTVAPLSKAAKALISAPDADGKVRNEQWWRNRNSQFGSISGKIDAINAASGGTYKSGSKIEFGLKNISAKELADFSKFGTVTPVKTSSSGKATTISIQFKDEKSYQDFCNYVRGEVDKLKVLTASTPASSASIDKAQKKVDDLKNKKSVTENKLKKITDELAEKFPKAAKGDILKNLEKAFREAENEHAIVTKNKKDYEEVVKALKELGFKNEKEIRNALRDLHLDVDYGKTY